MLPAGSLRSADFAYAPYTEQDPFSEYPVRALAEGELDE